jgi:hypothetical protein
MGLLDDVQKETYRHGGQCSVGHALAAMPPNLRAETIEVLALPLEQAQHAAIVRALKKRDVTLSAFSVARHRRGDCACVRVGLRVSAFHSRCAPSFLVLASHPDGDLTITATLEVDGHCVPE